MTIWKRMEMTSQRWKFTENCHMDSELNTNTLLLGILVTMSFNLKIFKLSELFCLQVEYPGWMHKV